VVLKEEIKRIHSLLVSHTHSFNQAQMTIRALEGKVKAQEETLEEWDRYYVSQRNKNSALEARMRELDPETDPLLEMNGVDTFLIAGGEGCTEGSPAGQNELNELLEKYDLGASFDSPLTSFDRKDPTVAATMTTTDLKADATATMGNLSSTNTANSSPSRHDELDEDSEEKERQTRLGLERRTSNKPHKFDVTERLEEERKLRLETRKPLQLDEDDEEIFFPEDENEIDVEAEAALAHARGGYCAGQCGHTGPRRLDHGPGSRYGYGYGGPRQQQ